MMIMMMMMMMATDATQIFADVDETQVQIEKRLRTAGVEKSTSRRY